MSNEYYKEELELLYKCSIGDKDAQQKYLDCYLPIVKRAAFRILGDLADKKVVLALIDMFHYFIFGHYSTIPKRRTRLDVVIGQRAHDFFLDFIIKYWKFRRHIAP